MELLAVSFFGIRCAGSLQGLVKIETVGHECRLPEQQGKPLVYIDYLETAPWNEKPLMKALDRQTNYGGVGSRLVEAGVRRSLAEEFRGRAEHLTAGQAAARPLRQAFTRLVQLKRRERALSMEDFAQHADVDLVGVVGIETDDRFVPSGLCVNRIAAFFKLPERLLMALAGLLSVKDAQFQDASLRFAARSASIDELSNEERDALDA